MTTFFVKHAATCTALLLITSSAIQDEETSPSEAGPVKGPSLAQGSLKVDRAGLLSESTEDDTFGQLDDAFDEQQTMNRRPIASGGVLAQIAAKLGGAKFFSELLNSQMSDFSGLDDNFDNTAWEMEQMESEEEPYQFSWKAFLTNPSLYFTIAIVLFGGLLLTLPADSAQQETASAHSNVNATNAAEHTNSEENITEPSERLGGILSDEDDAISQTTTCRSDDSEVAISFERAA